jgi:hypothetical protein
VKPTHASNTAFGGGNDENQFFISQIITPTTTPPNIADTKFLIDPNFLASHFAA